MLIAEALLPALQCGGPPPSMSRRHTPGFISCGVSPTPDLLSFTTKESRQRNVARRDFYTALHSTSREMI